MTMFTGLIVTLLIILFIIFFIYYKRDMLIRLFSLRIEDPTLQLQNQLQETANTIIDRLETQITQLEYLLEEADKRIDILNQQLQEAKHCTNNPGGSSRTEPDYSVGREVSNESALSKEIVSEAKNTENLNKQDLIEEKNRRQLVLGLAEQGYTITEIAKATAIGKGEIMLLLQLNKK